MMTKPYSYFPLMLRFHMLLQLTLCQNHNATQVTINVGPIMSLLVMLFQVSEAFEFSWTFSAFNQFIDLLVIVNRVIVHYSRVPNSRVGPNKRVGTKLTSLFMDRFWHVAPFQNRLITYSLMNFNFRWPLLHDFLSKGLKGQKPFSGLFSKIY